MTRLLTCGWETGDLAELGASFVSSGTGGVYAVASQSGVTARTPGAYMFQATVSFGARAYAFTFASSKTDIWCRFSLYLGPNMATEVTFLQFNDSGGARQGHITYNTSDSKMRIYNGSTTLGTTSATISVNAWHTIEVHWSIASATSGTSELWVDGVQLLNLTAVDNSESATLNIQSVAFGFINSVGANGVWINFDDFAVNDTSGSINNGQIQDGRVVLLKPSGAGSNTNQSRGGTDSGANWSQVDEVPMSMADYVYSAAVGTRDTYALADIPSGTWSVNCVEAIALAQKSDAGAASIGVTLKSGATTDEATAAALATTQAYYRKQYETDPNTSSAWTTTAVNALEAGTTVR